jgi:hypothetical protein
MNLAEMQRDFQAWLVSASNDAAARLGSGAGLNVYQNNYRVQLIDCLEASYPHVRSLLGEAAFLAAAVTHVDRNPPHAWTLDAYGDNFDATLMALYPANPDVHELARIELALARAFVAADSETLNADALAQVDWDTATLRFVPSLELLPATTNAAEIWSALQRGETQPESTMLAEAAGVVVCRRAYSVFLENVDAVEYAALRQLQSDASFARLCGTLVEQLGEAEGIAKAGALLVSWIGRAWLAAIA